MKVKITIHSHSGTLSFPLLDAAYQSIVYGNNEPDTVRCSPKTRQRIIALMGGGPEVRTIRFNNAQIVSDDGLPDGKIIISHPNTKGIFPHDEIPQAIVTLL